jgi:hypothetical protein
VTTNNLDGREIVMAKASKSAVADAKTESAQVSARMDASEPENHGKIAALAYQFWQERGCPIGSPEEDWFRAEQALRRQKTIEATQHR